MVTNNANTHYLDYWSDYKVALHNAHSLYSFIRVKKMSKAFVKLMEKMVDADEIRIDLAVKYVTEINFDIDFKLKTLLN